ncbi:MAG: FliH/SctL family protein, partial [Simplicispira sp.]|nr:FliH/SctL family protein [Simplicispira sp.]
MKTVSSRNRAYSRFIPKEEVEAFTPWNFSAVDGSGVLLPQPEEVVDPAAELEAQAAALALQAAEEAARQERHQQECEDAYAQGLKKGREDTSIEWQQRMDDYIAGEGQEMARRLDTVVQALDASLQAMQQHMAQDVLQLACDIARQVVRQELHVNQDALKPVVTEALEILVSDGR